MESPWLIAISRQAALQRQMDAVANNIANINTPACKAEYIMFPEYLVRPQRNVPLLFVEDKGMVRDLSEGLLTKMGNPFDVALSDDGDFIVSAGNGQRYTRSGRFQLDADGQIVNRLGQPVLSEGGQPIVIPPGTCDVSIVPDGTVSADTAVVGSIGVVRFNDQRAMKREGNNLYSTSKTGTPGDRTRILQGMLEASNVNPVEEMTKMIEVHRAYATNQRVLQDEHDRIRRAARVITGASESA